MATVRLKKLVEEDETFPQPRHRTTHACEPCQRRKTKCSGDKPICANCDKLDIACHYIRRKRDYVHSQIERMHIKAALYESTLKDLMTRVAESDRKLIQKALIGTDSNNKPKHSIQLESLNDWDYASENSDEVIAKSITRLHTVASQTGEDFTRSGANTTGYMGQQSDTAWMQQARRQSKIKAYDTTSDSQERSELRLSTIHPGGDESLSVQASSYHLDDRALPLDDTVNAYEMPLPDQALTLFSLYVQRVHPSFPIIGEMNLQNQLTKFLAKPKTNVPYKWRAIMNMVFAIAARYSYLVDANWQAKGRDDLLYFSRARKLIMNGDLLLEHPDLQIIQILGMMSYYLLAIDHVNRAWVLAAWATRNSIALALHLRNESADLANGLKEMRYRVWWSLYTLEHHLCSITGRSSCIREDQYTTPLPAPIGEEAFDSQLGALWLGLDYQRTYRRPFSIYDVYMTHVLRPKRMRSQPMDAIGLSISISGLKTGFPSDTPPSAALYFLHLVQLFRLRQAFCRTLYSPDGSSLEWTVIQAQMKTGNELLDKWVHALPPLLDFRQKSQDHAFLEARLMLAFFYYDTCQVLCRHCLSRRNHEEMKPSTEQDQFDDFTASRCVDAAQRQIALMSDEPRPVELLKVGPWTNIVPLLVRSASVLLLDMLSAEHDESRWSNDAFVATTKVVRWLHALGHCMLAAARAWRLCNQLLREAAAKANVNLESMPDSSPLESETVDGDINGLTSIDGQLARFGSKMYSSLTGGYDYTFSTGIAVPDLVFSDV